MDSAVLPEGQLTLCGAECEGYLHRGQPGQRVCFSNEDKWCGPVLDCGVHRRLCPNRPLGQINVSNEWERTCEKPCVAVRSGSTGTERRLLHLVLATRTTPVRRRWDPRWEVRLRAHVDFMPHLVHRARNGQGPCAAEAAQYLQAIVDNYASFKPNDIVAFLNARDYSTDPTWMLPVRT